MYRNDSDSQFTYGIKIGEDCFIHIRFYEGLISAFRQAEKQYLYYRDKNNKTDFERGYFEGIKLYLSRHKEDFYARGFSPEICAELNSRLNFFRDKGFTQEIISDNETRPRKRVKKKPIEWTDEDDKLIYSAVKKYTTDFISLPAGYSREDVLQEAGQAWVKRLREKGGHDPAKGEKSTLLYRVVQNTIQDLIKAANTDKRKVIQHQAEFNDEYSINFTGETIGPDNKEDVSELYEGGESKKNIGKGDIEPTKRNEKDAIRWKREQETDKRHDQELKE